MIVIVMIVLPTCFYVTQSDWIWRNTRM